MKIAEKYRLYLTWVDFKYDGGYALLEGAKFYGPVLKRARKLEPFDKIKLDFTQQNNNTDLLLPSSFYIATLEWKKVVYREDGIYLDFCILRHEKIGSLKSLREISALLIDCSRHEEYMKRKYLVYPAWALNKSGKVIQREDC